MASSRRTGPVSEVDEFIGRSSIGAARYSRAARRHSGPAVRNSQFPKGSADCRKCTSHLALAERPDTADAESVSDGELAGVDYIAPLTQTIIEALKFEARVGGHKDSDD